VAARSQILLRQLLEENALNPLVTVSARDLDSKSAHPAGVTFNEQASTEFAWNHGCSCTPTWFS
jgi:hypothetical protein